MPEKLDLLANLGARKEDVEQALAQSRDEQIFIFRFIPLLFSNAKDSNAIRVRVATGLFGSRPPTRDEFYKIASDLREKGHQEYVFNRSPSKSRSDGDMVIFDAFDDSPGAIESVIESTKKLPMKLKVELGVSFIDKDRIAIVKNRFWTAAADRPRGIYHLDDLN